MGKLNEAILHFKHALAIDAFYQSAQRNFKRATEIRRHIDTAVLKLRKLLKSGPGEHTINTYAKRLHNAKKALDDVVGQYQHVLKTQPGYSSNAFDMNNLPEVCSALAEYQRVVFLLMTKK